jgi:hypothetical protein
MDFLMDETHNFDFLPKKVAKHSVLENMKLNGRGGMAGAEITAPDRLDL